MKRYLSGCEKKKRKKENEQFVEKLPKISAFLQQTSSSAQEASTSADIFSNSNDAASCSSSGDNLACETPAATSSRIDIEEEGTEEEDNQCSDHDTATESVSESSLLSEDPSLWPEKLTDRERVEIVKKGPVQIKNFPFPPNSDQPPRKFTKENYSMTMRNGEKINRKWLLYSVSADAVYCFGCRVFGESKTALSSNGFRSWKHLSEHLRMHEKSKDHTANMEKWLHLAERLKLDATIDSVNQQLINQEMSHWKMVLRRLFAIVCHLAERNLAFRGHSEHLYEPRNGNFLGQVELMAQFDPVLNEHLMRIKNNDRKHHYLSKQIQNEMIAVIAQKTRNAVVALVQKAKYFAIIMDCTPDNSHTEQLSIVFRIVNCESDVGVSIEEHFIGFVDVHDTTGKGLFDTFIDLLNKLQLNISDCRGQAYDNGSNMKGKHQGVQKRVLDVNHKALYVPCGSHNLNLVICDAAQSSIQSVSFFGLLQRVYTLFSSSVQRWEIMQEHVDLTVKSLSATRWECRIDSVKAMRYQMPQFIKALEAVLNHAMGKKDAETVSSCKGILKELQTWKFLTCLVVWYNILFQVNHISKLFQSPKVSIETLQRETNALQESLQEYRETGLKSAQTEAREIAEKLDVEMELPEERQRTTTKRCLYEGREETKSTPEERFNREFFLPLIDKALCSIRDRFAQTKVFFDLYGFLYSLDHMRKAVSEGTLAVSCQKMEVETDDVDGADLEREIMAAIRGFPSLSSPTDMLSYIFRENLLDCYPNLSIALRVLLTLPVTVASGERSFSALKLIKTYLRSTMSQERLSDLAVISIEQHVRRKLDMEDVITAFANAKARKVKF